MLYKKNADKTLQKELFKNIISLFFKKLNAVIVDIRL